MAQQIALRPAAINGCLQSFTEPWTQTQRRTEMENGDIKTRRRVTAAWRQAEATITLKRELYLDFKRWMEIDCRDGELPTWLKMPYGAEEAWRVAEAPAIDWTVDQGAKAFRVSLKLEQSPMWRSLVAP
jgi:hypothetical protein